MSSLSKFPAPCCRRNLVLPFQTSCDHPKRYTMNSEETLWISAAESCLIFVPTFSVLTTIILVVNKYRNSLFTDVGRFQRLVPKTSLSSPPWPEVKLPDPIKEAKLHKETVQKVNELIATGQYGRLFAVVHFASRQWKVTSEDLILIENHIPAECGDRIRMEKVLLVGADDFTLLGKPLLGKDLVRVEATVIEKTESWPRINMKFHKRHRFQRKKIIIQPQTVLRINTIEIASILS